MTRREPALNRLRKECLAYPETCEQMSWGHPNFKAGRKVFAAQFFVTPYGRGLWVSVWADTPLDWRLLTRLLERSYRTVAITRMIRALDVSRPARAARPS